MDTAHPRTASSDLAPTRRTVLKAAGAGVGLWFVGSLGGRAVAVEAELDPTALGILPGRDIRKWAAPLLIPPAMPRAGTIRVTGGKNADLYDIALRQHVQQILPPELGATTVWDYGPATAGGRRAAVVFHAPSATIEARHGRPVRIRWRNELVDPVTGSPLSHLLPVDPTLHWANPAGGLVGRDSRPQFETTPPPYDGPVPAVTHVHGAAGVGDESDGYPEAWYLPAGVAPAGYAEVGTWYEYFRERAAGAFGVEWAPGSATSQYPNTQRAGTLWYHDHTLGMTRANVYAGPAGFYIIRGGPEGDDVVLDSRTGRPAVLPGPAPRDGDGFPARKTYYEIPLAIQDRTFTDDGALFYPDTRAFFDGTTGPYVPDGDVAPIWNPEFFGDAMMVNGRTWPSHSFEQRRYRLRLLNGCNSRFLILDFTAIPGAQVWQIGTEGGFLAAPVDLMATATPGQLLLAPAERADVVLDLTAVPLGSYELLNVGPDEPFGGGVPGVDFDAADPLSTGLVLRLDVVPALGADPSTPAPFLQLPAIAPLVPTVTRSLALVEEMSTAPELADDPPPIAALLATVTDGTWTTRMWHDDVTENPAVGTTETWEIYNATADAHPIHIHETLFQVVDRQPIEMDHDAMTVAADGVLGPRPPEANEAGWKDTVTAYPGEVTRLRMRFDRAGQYVWHCHIVEHEDNEMMRPFRIGPVDPSAPVGTEGHA